MRVKFRTNSLGVTLIETMLVLGVSAMIIVMSLKYYESATASLQVNSLLQITQGITGFADGLAQGTGSYEDGGVSTDTISKLMSLNTAWGGTVEISNVDRSSYDVTFTKVPASVCIQASSRLKANSKFILSSNDCIGTREFSYTYDVAA